MKLMQIMGKIWNGDENKCNYYGHSKFVQNLWHYHQYYLLVGTFFIVPIELLMIEFFEKEN